MKLALKSLPISGLQGEANYLFVYSIGEPTNEHSQRTADRQKQRSASRIIQLEKCPPRRLLTSLQEDLIPSHLMS